MSAAADWVERNSDIRIKLNADQRAAVGLLVDAMNTGVYNLSVNWNKVRWDDKGARFCMYAGGGLGTYDFNHLTRFVILAHDRCMRVYIEPCNRQHLYIWIHQRDPWAGEMARGHDTLDQAVAAVRKLPPPDLEARIKHMVNRFLGWKLPANFRPDCGIQFDAEAAQKLNPRNGLYEPNGTNLFDATQATEMVKHMLEGLP